MKAMNLSNNRIIAENLECADKLIKRMRGLLGKDSMPAGSGLWIKPCKGVHTFCMKFPIDVVFLDEYNNVLAMEISLPPNRMTPVRFRASSVIELPAGTIENVMMSIGDKIKIV